MINTKEIGDITEAMVLAAMSRQGHRMLIPWGDRLRYDLAYDDQGTFVRVQCKTGRYAKGVVEFDTSSGVGRSGPNKRNYKGEADVFGVYCPELNTVYVVPVSQCGNRGCSLRIDPTKNLQTRRVRSALDFQIYPVI